MKTVRKRLEVTNDGGATAEDKPISFFSWCSAANYSQS